MLASLAERAGLCGQVQCIYLDRPCGVKFDSNFQLSTSRDMKGGAKENTPTRWNSCGNSIQCGIDEGDFFVFRLKSPRNLIGGYGRLVSSINAPIRLACLAWESLGRANGVSSSEALIRAIAKYRKDNKASVDSFIGCRILSDPIFFNEEDWFSVPDDWSSNIVTGTVYSTQSQEGARLFSGLQERTNRDVLFRQGRSEFEGFLEFPQAAYGAPILTTPRLGQAAFRLRIADIYEYKCAVSDTKVLPALDSAHIVPFARGGDHSP